MKDTTVMALGESLGKIAKLDRDSEEAEHTDIGDIWDVLRFAQDTLRAVVSEVIGDDDDDQDALDARVHDHFSALASDLNNRGADEQRAFLRREAELPTEWPQFYNPPGAPKMDKVCETCGEGDIAFEGYIGWSIESQEFYVIDICDKGHMCKTCDGTTYAIDVEYKPLAVELTHGSEPTENDKTATFRFNTQPELLAFREGLRASVKLENWEVTYTDEESECSDS